MAKQVRRLTSSSSNSNDNINSETSSSRLSKSNDYSDDRSYMSIDDDSSSSEEESPLKKRKKRAVECDESNSEESYDLIELSGDDALNSSPEIRIRRKSSGQSKRDIALKHDSNGLLSHECDYKDICDCLFTSCEGCFSSCAMCKGHKCGPICRKNRGYLMVKYIDPGMGTTRVNPCVSIYEN